MEEGIVKTKKLNFILNGNLKDVFKVDFFLQVLTFHKKYNTITKHCIDNM